MTETQIQALLKWIDAQTYSKASGTFGDFLDAVQIKLYLPGAIEKILKEVA
jgi:hypothetical protein